MKTAKELKAEAIRTVVEVAWAKNNPDLKEMSSQDAIDSWHVVYDSDPLEKHEMTRTLMLELYDDSYTVHIVANFSA